MKNGFNKNTVNLIPDNPRVHLSSLQAKKLLKRCSILGKPDDR